MSNFDQYKDKAINAAKKAQRNEKVRDKEREMGEKLTDKLKTKFNK
ncbi:hypothetical protein [Niallia circulans]|nr:hypothetical protein [Niallia circulans]